MPEEHVMYNLELLFKNIELVSTNRAYLSMPRYLPARKSRIIRNGKPVRVSTYKTKSPAYKKMEEELWKSMDSQLDQEDVEKYQAILSKDQNAVVRVTVDFGFSEDGFYSRDTSNYMKALEDAVKVKMGIDDSRHLEVNLSKHRLKSGDWVTIYQLEIIHTDEYVDRDWHSENLRF